MPADLRKALAASAKSLAAWKDLTPISRRDFIIWTGSANETGARGRRIEKACDMLAAGKRLP